MGVTSCRRVSGDIANPSEEDYGGFMADNATAVQEGKTEEVEDLDPEEQELKDAQAALEAEKTGDGEIKAGGEPLQGEPGTETAPEADKGKQDDPKPDQEQKMVPLTALQAERQKNQQLREQNAYILGVAEANKANAANQNQDPPEPELTPEQKLQAIREERIKLAEQHDDAELSSADWERKKQKLEDQEYEIRQAQLQPAPAAQPVVPVQDLGLEQHLVNLEQAYDGLDTLSERQAEHLKNLVLDQAAATGNPIQPGAAGTARLREEIADLATRVFPDQIKLAEKPEAGQTQTQQGLSKQAKDRDAAINKAQGMPPDVSQTGARDDGQPLSEAEVMAKMEGMTDEEQADFLDLNPRFLQQVIGSNHL
jgi:hypothetical protein